MLPYCLLSTVCHCEPIVSRAFVYSYSAVILVSPHSNMAPRDGSVARCGTCSTQSVSTKGRGLLSLHPSVPLLVGKFSSYRKINVQVMYKQPCENMFERRRKKKQVGITQYNWKKGPVSCKGHRGVNIQREKHTSIIDFIIRWCGPTGAILLKSYLELKCLAQWMRGQWLCKILVKFHGFLRLDILAKSLQKNY